MLAKGHDIRKRVQVWLSHARFLGWSQAMYFIAQQLRRKKVVKLKVSGIPTPVFCRTVGTDRYALWEIFDELLLEIDLRDSPQLIIDGGANVGYASLYFANKYPKARVIAVEPDPENCTLFHMNCSTYHNIELIQGALWSSDAALIIENPSADSNAFRVVETSSHTTGSIKGYTVADILARSGKEHIDLLKLDIEGSEEQLFSSNYREWIDRVKAMMIELHSESCHDTVLAVVRNHGFSISASGETPLDLPGYGRHISVTQRPLSA